MAHQPREPHLRPQLQPAFDRGDLPQQPSEYAGFAHPGDFFSFSSNWLYKAPNSPGGICVFQVPEEQQIQGITFGKSFNQTLEHVAWPSHLQCLSFGRDFDQTLEPVTWPSCLQILTLGFRFNQSLQRVAWPPQLQSLTLGYLFNQSLENVTLPRSLQHLVVKDVVLSACQEQKQAAAQHGPTYSCSGGLDFMESRDG